MENLTKKQQDKLNECWKLERQVNIIKQKIINLKKQWSQDERKRYNIVVWKQFEKLKEKGGETLVLLSRSAIH